MNRVDFPPHRLRVLLLFLALTVVVTYPQVRGLGTLVPYHSDPYFSMWRMGWVAHAIHAAPRALFDANIFYPARHTLGYADALLLEGTVAAPLFWMGVNPVLIYNLLLFAAFALSGYAMYLLARSLTGSTAGAIVAGVVYAFAPYRFCHYMHLELQVVFWIPVALLLIHRIVEHGRIRDGVWLGLVVAGQLLSTIYLGIYAITYFVALTPFLLALSSLRQARRFLIVTAVGAALTLAIVTPYMLAYKQVEQEVGTRGLDEVKVYSASLADYQAAPAMNRLYSWTANTKIAGADEMNLFPGVLACVLAGVGIVTGRGRVRIAYLAGLVVAVEMTRGASSAVYLWLFEHLDTFRALRSPARFATLVNLSLAVLSAYGVAFLLDKISDRRWKPLAGALLVAILVAEYSSSPSLAPAPPPTRIDSFLSKRPPSIVVELPLMLRGGFWGSLDAIYMYQSIGHFQRMLNGYSGRATPEFYRMREQMAAFPDTTSLDFLRGLKVDYVVVRAGLYDPAPRAALLERMNREEALSLEAMWPEGPAGPEAVFRVRPGGNQQ